MAKSILLFLLFHLSLESVEFVLFTQPKTATHLLIPILTNLTGKDVYWAPEYALNAEPFEGNFAEASQNPESLFFSLTKAPWNRQIMDMVWSISKKKNSFLHTHAPYTLAMENYLASKKCINFFVKRDPRDQIVSLLNHYKYINFNDKIVEQLATDDERLLYMIQNESRLHTLHYMGWIKSPQCCTLDFDKLMGTHGGSATHAQAIKEMRKIAIALQLNPSNSALERVYKQSFGKGWNFFKGKVGSWKDYFNDEHKLAAKKEIGDLLIQLGYEKDFDW